MWSQFKTIPSVFQSKMTSKADELPLETLQDSTSPSVEQKVPEEDESSIEALTWSDFDDEEMEMARKLAEKEFPNSTNVEVQDNHEGKMGLEMESESDGSTQTSVILAGQRLPDVEFPEEILESEPTTAVDQVDLEADDFVAMSMISSKCSACTAAVSEDSASNAPVLDDGPIWGKGEKSYRFHENRKINQKLTFGVLISVVLAIGIGVGNLVAYNEYESEGTKADHVHCPSPVHSPQTDEKPNDLPLPTGFPSSTHIRDKGPSPIHSASLDPDANSKETLAYVVKSIDELSRKFDQFQNTTKQLSGIIVMKDDTRTSPDKDRKHRDTFKSKEKTIEDDLLPTFNDDISSWETSGERLVKFSDVVYEETSHEVPTSDNDFVEGRPTRISQMDEGNSLPTPLAGADEYERGAKDIALELAASPQSPSSKNSAPPRYKQEKLPENDRFKRKRENSVHRETSEDQRGNRGKTVSRDETAKKLKREKSVDREESDRTRPNKQFKQQKTQEKEKVPSPPRKVEINQVPLQTNKKLRRQKAIDLEDFSKTQNKHGKPQYERRMDIDAVRNEIYSKKKFQPEKSNDKEQKRNFKEDKDDQRKKSKKEKVVAHQTDEKWMKPKKYKKDKSVDRDYVRFDAKFSNSGNNLEDFKTSSKQYTNGKPNKESFQFGSNKNNEIKNQEPSNPSEFGDPSNYRPKKEIEDWESSRAKAREDQRVQQNWNTDFNSEKVKRKRNQNWQIERDRIREKFRKDYKN